MTAPVLLTEQQAAEALQLCTRTLRKARQEGRISFVLIGRAIRYTHSDLETLIESYRQDARQCKPTRHVASARTGKIVPFTARQ